MTADKAISTKKYNYEKQGQKTPVRVSDSDCKWQSVPVSPVLRGSTGRSLGSRIILPISTR